ncbi:hypothetical protein ACW9HC_33845 [Nocardia gipuzkoensis]
MPATATAQRDGWRQAQASIHHDGTVTLTAAVGGHPRPARGETDDGGVINSSTIKCLVADLLGLVRETAKRLTTTEYEIRIGIEWDGGTPLTIQTVDNHGFPCADKSHRLARYSPVEATIDAGADDAAYEQQVRELALDCVNQGGVSYLKAIQIPARARIFTPSSSQARRAHRRLHHCADTSPWGRASGTPPPRSLPSRYRKPRCPMRRWARIEVAPVSRTGWV